MLPARHGQVKLHFVLKFLLDPCSKEQCSNPQEEICQDHRNSLQAISSTLPMAVARRVQLSDSCCSCFRPVLVMR